MEISDLTEKINEMLEIHDLKSQGDLYFKKLDDLVERRKTTSEIEVYSSLILEIDETLVSLNSILIKDTKYLELFEETYGKNALINLETRIRQYGEIAKYSHMKNEIEWQMHKRKSFEKSHSEIKLLTNVLIKLTIILVALTTALIWDAAIETDTIPISLFKIKIGFLILAFATIYFATLYYLFGTNGCNYLAKLDSELGLH